MAHLGGSIGAWRLRAMGVTASGFSGEPEPARLRGVYKSVVGDSIFEPDRWHCTSPPIPGGFMYKEGKTRCAGGASSTRRARPGHVN